MKHPRAFALSALVAGLLFGAGLVVGGMVLPEKVRGFLDFTGHWDPTLALVMIGAITVHVLAYWLVRRRTSPLLAEAFQLPTRRDLDAKLVLGAAIFGLGWGLGGYCPGPAITSLTGGSASVAAFLVTMLGASWATSRLEERMSGATAATPSGTGAAKTPNDPERRLPAP